MTPELAFDELVNFVQANKQVLFQTIPSSLSERSLQTYNDFCKHIASVITSQTKLEEKKEKLVLNWSGTVLYKHRAFPPIRSENLGILTYNNYEDALTGFKELAVSQLNALFGEEFDKYVEKWEVRVRPCS